jgi:hypothetical protein
MKNIPRHAVDAERVQEGIEGDGEMLAKVVQSAISRAAALSIVLSAARSYAGYLSAGDGKTAEIIRVLRIGAQAAAAIFALGASDREVEFTLGTQQVKLAATGPTDATHPGNWRTGWWLAHIVRDQAVIDTLAATPLEVLRRSSSRADECQYLFIEALQGFRKLSPAWSSQLQMALDATDPEEVKLSDEDFVLNILMPEMQMLFRLALGEIAPFGDALLFAVERHKKYWSKGKRKEDPDGYLALGPLALLSIALDTGMPVEIESGYIPRELIESTRSKT